MCWTVTPPSADCEIIILLACVYEEVSTIIRWEERLLARSVACCNGLGHVYVVELVCVFFTDF
jgi:hypothetical protein